MLLPPLPTTALAPAHCVWLTMPLQLCLLCPFMSTESLLCFYCICPMSTTALSHTHYVHASAHRILPCPHHVCPCLAHPCPMLMFQSCVLHCILSLSPPIVAHLSLLTHLSVTVTGFAGTPGYLSPEVLRKEAYGKPVDIWACGKSQSLLSPFLVPAPSLPPSQTWPQSQS